MNVLQRPTIWLYSWIVGWASLMAASPAAPPATFSESVFETQIRPLLVERCYECHSARSASLKGGLRLDAPSGWLRGGKSRPAVHPGHPEDSLLIEAVSYRNPDLQMPPKARLAEREIALLSQWIQAGAPAPEVAAENPQPPRPSSPSTHWAFLPLTSSPPPQTRRSAEAYRSPIDSFLGATLAEHGLHFAPEVSRRALIRRAYFDLCGLPPSPEQIEAFVRDPAPDAFARLVDRLLASPHYGERWARWWLDLARYADTNGQDENKVMANAWRYRDWVVRALNSNLPFDEFGTWQLAGDLLPTNGLSEEAIFDRWTATGFLVLGPKMLAEQDKPKLVMDLVDEQIDVVSRAFLGLTVGCARCHDHKFDPIPTRDYYALAGIFSSTRAMENLDFVSKFNERRVTPQAQLEALAAHERAMDAMNRSITNAIDAADAALRSELRSRFPTELVAAKRRLDGSPDLSETKSPVAKEPTATVSTEQAARIHSLLSLDPATHSVSRVLRSVGTEPERVAAYLDSLDRLAAPTPRESVAPGKIGAAFQATGSNSLSLPHALNLEPTNLTVEAWVWAEEFPTGGDERRWLVSKNANEWAEGHYALMLDRDRPGAYLNIGGGKENVFALWSTGPKLEAHRWAHLAFTYDGQVLRLFVDGTAAGELVINRTRVPGTTDLVLAKRPDGYIHFRGRLDEVRVYDRPLAKEDISTHVRHPELPSTQGVIARWDFNDLSEAQREAVTQYEVRDALYGPDGPLSLPADTRSAYPQTTREHLARLEGERDALRAAAPPAAAFALAVMDGPVADLPVYVRGNHLNPGPDRVPRGFVRVASTGSETAPPREQSGRLELAHWLFSAQQPLTARVIVNRVWQAHFGEGLVRTPDNFGLRGERPSHPELLDWLAENFRQSGWDLKQLHRLLLNSRAYQQASRRSPEANPDADPENRWLSYFPRQRLEAEMVRDSLLAVSGQLDTAMGGTLVQWKNNDYVPADEAWAKSVRRSLYLPIVRDRVYDVFTIFDFANPSVGTAKRAPTVVSHQALFFLNSSLANESAEAMAKQLLVASGDDARRIATAYQAALGRPPRDMEVEKALRFLDQLQAGRSSNARLEAWSTLCQMLFAANEFLYLE